MDKIKNNPEKKTTLEKLGKFLSESIEEYWFEKDINKVRTYKNKKKEIIRNE